MADWLKSMQQTFEYYIVDPATWKDSKQLDNVIKSTINRDEETETLGSATIDVVESFGECYVRIYLITVQNGIREKHPLGTFLVQTPTLSFDGKIRNVSLDAYTPLLELKENPPPLGYFVRKNAKIMDEACNLTQEHLRAPVVETSTTDKLNLDFISDTEDTWLTFLTDLISNAKYKFGIDEMGRIIFLPIQDVASLQPVWTYTDDNSSILYPDISIDHDLYGVPNVVEVIYSVGQENHYVRVVNDNPNSPTSTINRGREITKRVTNPDLVGIATKSQIKEYAEQLLKNLSSIEYTVTYTHGYCPVRLGDCVRLNYSRAGLTNIKARVISQSIDCTPGCKVTEKAVFTVNLWE